MSFGSQINYKQLLQRHKRIRIPMIQRDYAQGRPTEEEVRDEFLESLKDALLKPATDPTLPLNLDFIYGSVEGEIETRFLPLDGQQRLTTLFLLHWYLAWKDDQWEVFDQLFQEDSHARFTYTVRPSSSEFFDELVSYRPSARPVEFKELSKVIVDQHWYFRRWRLDPTIQAVLCMLDTIHKKFASLRGLFSRLVDETQPAITFQLLDLENFGLSDDLYIKMNARGIPLTAFETFKARYEQELKGQLEGIVFKISEESFTAAEYVARRMDTTWADLFWNLRDEESDLYDEAFMNVFRAIALITRNPADPVGSEDVSTLRDRWKAPSYTDFHTQGWLDEQFTLALIPLLDSWSAKSEGLSCHLPDKRYFDEIAFFSDVTSDGATLPYTDIVQFAAYVRFIIEHQGSIDSNAFQEWMRVIHNLSVNTEYNRADDLLRSIRGLNELIESSGDVLRYFAESEKAASGFSELQIAEEKLKTELILANDAWRELIDLAESHGYFRGQIGFLLDFSGTLAMRSESDPKFWDETEHSSLQVQFSRYLGLANMMFSAKGLDDPGKSRWQRALLSIDDYLLPSGRNHSFLRNPAAYEASWKRLLRDTGSKTAKAGKILKTLWDQLTPDADITQQLDIVINSAQQLEPWRDEIVYCPEVIKYCERKFIRRHYSGTIYLLRKSQMNGYHAELFTYSLFIRLEQRSRDFNVLKPWYEEAMGTYYEPGARLDVELHDKKVTLSVENKDGGFRIQIPKNDGADSSNIEDLLVSAGYTEIGESFRYWSSRSDIEAHLKELDKAISSRLDSVAY